MYLNVRRSNCDAISLIRRSNLLLLVALDEERCVHDHLVADGAVDPRGHRHIAKTLQEFGDVRSDRCWRAVSIRRPCCIRAK